MRRLLLIPLLAVGVAILGCEQRTPQAPDEVPGVQLSKSPANADHNGNNCVCFRKRYQETGGGPRKKAKPKLKVTVNYRDDACDEEGECECDPGFDPMAVFGTEPIPPSACTEEPA